MSLICSFSCLVPSRNWIFPDSDKAGSGVKDDTQSDCKSSCSTWLSTTHLNWFLFHFRSRSGREGRTNSKRPMHWSLPRDAATEEQSQNHKGTTKSAFRFHATSSPHNYYSRHHLSLVVWLSVNKQISLFIYLFFGFRRGPPNHGFIP